jgi:hypothetical protein
LTLSEVEVPVAYSMLNLAHTAMVREAHPIYQFTCYWTAFNNIYIAIGARRGRRPRVKSHHGIVIRRLKGGAQIPAVDPVSERALLDMVAAELPADILSRLVQHPATVFFVERIPRWEGRLLATDAMGQALNGVLNVGYTRDRHNPVWAPIDTALFRKHQEGTATDDDYRALADQLLNVLYTVRNNTFHGGKRADDAGDTQVLEKALPLLRMVVETFITV